MILRSLFILGMFSFPVGTHSDRSSDPSQAGEARRLIFQACPASPVDVHVEYGTVDAVDR